jgi:hypothetical protein
MGESASVLERWNTGAEAKSSSSRRRQRQIALGQPGWLLRATYWYVREVVSPHRCHESRLCMRQT